MNKFIDMLRRDILSGMGFAPLTGRMPIVCSFCGDHYKDTPCLLEMDGKESHGVCEACRPAYDAECAEESARLDAADQKEKT